MTVDAVALCATEPNLPAVLAALLAGRPDLRVRTTPGGGVAQVCDSAGGALVVVEGPTCVRVSGEAERLLGVPAPLPAWWVEARATRRHSAAAGVARDVVEALVAAAGGARWPDR